MNTWPDSPCATCSHAEAGRDGACEAQTLRNPRLCDLANPAHPDHAPPYRAMLAGEDPVEAAATIPTTVVKTASRDCPEATEPPPTGTINATLEMFRRMKACPHWQKAQDCGCGINRCALGKGDRGRVGHKDCFECLTAQEISPAAPARSS